MKNPEGISGKSSQLSWCLVAHCGCQYNTNVEGSRHWWLLRQLKDSRHSSKKFQILKFWTWIGLGKVNRRGLDLLLFFQVLPSSDVMFMLPADEVHDKDLLKSGFPQQSSVMSIAHKKSHGTNVVVVHNQLVNSKMAANLFYCHVIGCLQQQHSFRGISCGLWLSAWVIGLVG